MTVPTFNAQKAHWTAESKQIVSQATADWINMDLASSRQIVCSADIMRILDKDPGYISFFEKLERRGFKICRLSLARKLQKTLSKEDNKEKEQPSNSPRGRTESSDRSQSPALLTPPSSGQDKDR